MLISLSKNFIFVANLKTASTSIEKALRQFAEIALVEARFGKHMALSQIEQRFPQDTRQIYQKKGLVFGVVRDPVSYVLSLYNSHSGPRFATANDLYTGAMSFDEFISIWCKVNAGQLVQQSVRLQSNQLPEGFCTILRYEHLHDDWKDVEIVYGLPPLDRISMENVSPVKLKRSDLTESQLDWIKGRFSDDYALIDAVDKRKAGSL